VVPTTLGTVRSASAKTTRQLSRMLHMAPGERSMRSEVPTRHGHPFARRGSLLNYAPYDTGNRPAFRFYPEMKGRLIGRMRRLDTMRANAAGHGPALAKPSSHLRPRSWARLRCVWVNEEATGSGLKTKRAAPLARGWESRGKLFERGCRAQSVGGDPSRSLPLGLATAGVLALQFAELSCREERLLSQGRLHSDTGPKSD
jgi:hypothetical protein